jgi:hypothetical protein
MEKETARDLLQMIVDAANVGIRAQTKLLALEKVLKDRDPALYESYEKELRTQQSTTVLNPAGVGSLLEKLSRPPD